MSKPSIVYFYLLFLFIYFLGGTLSRLAYLFREFLLSQINPKYNLIEFVYLDLSLLSV